MDNFKNAIKAIVVIAVIILASACEKDVKPIFPTPPAKPRYEVKDTIKTKSTPTDTTKKPQKGINIVHNGR